MSIDDWDRHYKKLMNEEVEDLLIERSGELEANPFLPLQQRLNQTKDELMRKFRLKDATELIDGALGLIVTHLKERLRAEEWEDLLEEFISVDDSLCRFFEREQRGEISDDEYISLHEMCGISHTTLRHCYQLGQSFYDEEDLVSARQLFGFLTTIAPYLVDFWIALAMSDNKAGSFNGAIETLLFAERLFPEEVSIAIHLTSNYIAIGDDFMARQKLENAISLLKRDEEMAREWKGTVDYLRSRAYRNYKKLV